MTGPEPKTKIKKPKLQGNSDPQFAHQEVAHEIKQLKVEVSERIQLDKKNFAMLQKQQSATYEALIKLQSPPTSYEPMLVAGGLGIITLMIAGILFVVTKKLNRNVARLHKITSRLEKWLDRRSNESSASDQSPTADHVTPAKEESKTASVSVNEVETRVEMKVEHPVYLQRIDPILTFIPILNDRPNLLNALEIHMSWANQQEDSARVMLIINAINENRIKRLHDQLAQICLTQPTSTCGTQDEAWPFFEWALELCNLSLPATKQVSLDRCAAGDRFDGRLMRATTDVIEGNIKRVLMPGISRLKIKSVVEV